MLRSAERLKVNVLGELSISSDLTVSCVSDQILRRDLDPIVSEFVEPTVNTYLGYEGLGDSLGDSYIRLGEVLYSHAGNGILLPIRGHRIEACAVED